MLIDGDRLIGDSGRENGRVANDWLRLTLFDQINIDLIELPRPRNASKY